MAVLDRPVATDVQVAVGPTVTVTATAIGQIVYPSFGLNSNGRLNGVAYQSELRERFQARTMVAEPIGDDYEPEAEILAADPF